MGIALMNVATIIATELHFNECGPFPYDRCANQSAHISKAKTIAAKVDAVGIGTKSTGHNAAEYESLVAILGIVDLTKKQLGVMSSALGISIERIKTIIARAKMAGGDEEEDA